MPIQAVSPLTPDQDTRWNWRPLAFYLLVPLAFGAYGAINNWQLLGSAGFVWAVAFYLGHAFPPWLTTCLMTSLVMLLLRPWRPGPWPIMVAGHTAACFMVLPYINWLMGFFALHWPEAGMEADPGDPLGAQYWGYWLRAGVIWLGTNYLFDRFLGMPRYRYDANMYYGKAPPAAKQLSAVTGTRRSAGRPAFLERAPASLSAADVIAIKAEQHYIRVITPAKSYLVLHRFSDALAELAGDDGTQVHRSWWVRRSAIRKLHQDSRKMMLVLQTGAEIPVSGPYQALVRQMVESDALPTSNQAASAVSGHSPEEPS